MLVKKGVQNMTISKRAFAERIGVSAPTLYAWIAKNRDGIQAYVKADGIDADILRSEPWRSMAKPPKTEKGEPKKKMSVTQLTVENDLLRQRIEFQAEKIAERDARIAELKIELQERDERIDKLLFTINHQTAMLPKPKRTPGEALRDFLGIKQKQKPPADQTVEM